MKNNIKTLFTLVLSIGLFASCVNDTFNEPTSECVDPSIAKTKEIQDIYNVAPSTNGGVLYTADDVIEAVITSSDEGGNFFKTISLMSLDGTRGFSMPVDDYNLYTQKLQPGKKVYVKLKGLYIMRPTGGAIGLNIGAMADPTNSFGTLSRIKATVYKNHIIPTCTAIDEDTFVKRLTLAQLNNDAYLNTLVEVDNVQFESEGTTYGNNPNAASDKNENITDGTTTLVTRTSRFSNFAGAVLPLGRGTIRGVLTKFNSTYQLIIRNERDVKLTNPRVDFSTPIVGNANVFNATLNEPFTSYAANITNFPKYINDADFGPRYWQIKSFGSNQYIEMSSFNGTSNPGVPCNTFFMVPVDFTAANTFTFKEEMRFYREESPTGKKPLTVYYIKSEDYVAGSVVDRTKLVNITSSFNITYPAISQAENSFNSAGTYNIPAALTGNGYFIFEYYGTTTLTTTVQLDDIIIN